MLKISEMASQPGAPRTYLLEGRVSGLWVNELRRVCLRPGTPADGTVLDLSGVSFVDRAGLALFGDLAERGVHFTNGSPFITEQLKEVVHDLR
ncbi:MAG: hypothetical protein AB7I50_15440 [Vicinamibacterales bacterium]